jgi:hypothetical protein
MWIVIIVLALPLIAAAQSGENRTLTGHVTIATSKTGRTTVVAFKKDAAAKELEALFCVDLAPPAPSKIEFFGPARVVYRLQPIAGLPAGVKISGPENVASTLVVIPNQGKPWLFVAKGEKPLLAAGDPALVGAAAVNVSIVRRIDWLGDDGRRRGTDLEACLAPGG